MNREQGRAAKKALARRGVSSELADIIIRMKRHGSAPQELNDGDRVRLNISAIRRHPDYERLSEKYRSFIEDHAAYIFTVKKDNGVGADGSVWMLAEDPNGWLFWSGDLVKVREDDKE